MTLLAPISPALRLAAAAILLPCAFAPVLRAQNPAVPGPRALIVLDPAHGGPDSGAHLANQVLEKDVTLAFASRLRTALAGAGFNVVATRDSDPVTALTPDQRAEIANRPHVLACLILHATGTGTGAHLYVSALPPAPAPPATDPGERAPFAPIPWNSAQAGAIPQSLTLQSRLAAALQSSQLPVLRGRASVPPLDNVLCPAVAVEIAPLGDPGSDQTPVTDAAYQQRLADAITRALKSFRDAQSALVSASPRSLATQSAGGAP